MKIIFLGTNGWYPTETGNTICTLMESKRYYIVLDAGDGIYKLNRYITIHDKPIYIFLSHFHLDHIYGLHILDSFQFKQKIKIYGQPRTKEILNCIITSPYTLPFKKLKTKVLIDELHEGIHNSPKTPFKVECRYLSHVDPCFGYRFSIDGKIVAYCTDTSICHNMLGLSKNANAVIAECAFREGQLQRDSNQTHLSPKDSAIIAKKASAKQLLLTHFNAYHFKTIKERKKAEQIAKKIFIETSIARDELEITV